MLKAIFSLNTKKLSTLLLQRAFYLPCTRNPQLSILLLYWEECFSRESKESVREREENTKKAKEDDSDLISGCFGRVLFACHAVDQPDRL